MNSVFEALVGGDSLQERGELLAFFGVKGSADDIVVGGGSLGQLAHQPAALGGEIQGVVAAVGGVAAALDQPLFLHAVGKRDEPAGGHAETAGDGLLAGSWLGGDEAEESGLGWCQAEGGDPLGEQGGGPGAQLGQEERAARPRLVAGAGWGLRGRSHEYIIPRINDYDQ
jgi:hypothetical protein